MSDLLIDGELRSTTMFTASAFNVTNKFSEVSELGEEDEEALRYYFEIEDQHIVCGCDCGCGGDKIDFDLYAKGAALS